MSYDRSADDEMRRLSWNVVVHREALLSKETAPKDSSFLDNIGKIEAWCKEQRKWFEVLQNERSEEDMFQHYIVKSDRLRAIVASYLYGTADLFRYYMSWLTRTRYGDALDKTVIDWNPETECDHYRDSYRFRPLNPASERQINELFVPLLQVAAEQIEPSCSLRLYVLAWSEMNVPLIQCFQLDAKMQAKVYSYVNQSRKWRQRLQRDRHAPAILRLVSELGLDKNSQSEKSTA